ncbi:MAG: DUF2442 domain-containing protein [Anaerolineae bacterium]|nr:DUF2442 domain-containing protein [Anaerolineae bacterium]
MKKVAEVKALDGYKLWLRYADGVEGVVDLSAHMGKGVYAIWEDPREFAKAHIGPSGEIAWNEQLDMDADALYLKLTGKKPEDIFPRLHKLTTSC